MTLHHGDCLEVMRELPDASVDSVVTDPPYGLEFMGKEWDRLSGQPGYNERGRMTPASSGLVKSKGFDRIPNSFQAGKPMQAWHEQWATEAFRVLKPGGYLLAFGGTRTYHRLASAIEDAGFEIRDTLMWIYASGFPKSLDVSKALDKVAGAEREHVGYRPIAYPDSDTWGTPNSGSSNRGVGHGPIYGEPGAEFEKGFGKGTPITAPATDLARKWEGWGTALKPAHEPIVMARKPLIGTVAQNVTRYGTGALNIDGARIGIDLDKEPDTGSAYYEKRGMPYPDRKARGRIFPQPAQDGERMAQGRWPSNVLLSSPELFDEPNPGVVGSGTVTQDGTAVRQKGGQGAVHGIYGKGMGAYPPGSEDVTFGGGGGYSRFFIIPKADRAERERGLSGPPGSAVYQWGDDKKVRTCVDCNRHFANNFDKCPRCGGAWEWGDAYVGGKGPRRGNTHPTVKPIDLMRHLVRLVTPPGGTVLDPFAGSGSTLIAAEMEGFAWIGIEREAEYVAIAEGRLNGVQKGLGLR